VSLPPEILKKVKHLEVVTRKLVNNVFQGEYHSAFRGQGMTFSEFREYTPGDDVRTISWPLTARMGKPFVKVFEEEREMTLMLLVDISGSGDFGTGPYLKGEVIAHLAAVLSFSAVKNNDPVGLMLFTDQVEHFVPPKKGRAQVYRILRDLYYFKPRSRKTKLTTALDYLSGVARRKSTVFLFSDFQDQGFEEALRRVGKKHDLVSVVVEDPFEVELPDVGLLDVEDPETGEWTVIDTSSKAVRAAFAAEIKSQKDRRESSLRKAQVDRVIVRNEGDIVAPLIAYFKRRNRRG
jgi:uncharacterized protein (DUF58 family)